MENTSASEPVLKTYRVPEENLPRLRERTEKLARRARKLGVGAVAISVSEEVEIQKISEEGVVKRIVRWHTVTVSGTAPKLAGWTFVGTLQHLDGVDGNVLRTVPGEAMPVVYRAAASECDHCQTNRRRKDTFVVRSDAGEHKQVGRQCIADFLGHTDPHQIASFAEYLFSIGEACEESEGFGGDGGVRSEYIDLATFLGYVSACMRVSGWISRKAARAFNEAGGSKRATADEAFSAMFPSSGMSQRDRDALPKPEPRDGERVTAALAWVEQLVPRDGNDYEYNLKLVCGSGSGVLHRRCAGISASLLSAHTRFLGYEVERQQRATTSAHFGTIGVREVFVLTVTGLREIAGNYGATTIVSFATADGHVGKWFASGSPDVEIGETYRVKGTVKKHDDWKGQKQTLLSRCAVVGKASDPAPVAKARIRKVESVV